ncbi:MAG: hypothetical protein HY273_07645 [Gammaproteobacteria bacterium]|nr:hypothetical protein [Gammaproteobacteria bacterium]
MNTITRLLTSIFGNNTNVNDDAHLEALQGDSALIQRVCELRELELELAEAEASAAG